MKSIIDQLLPLWNMDEETQQIHETAWSVGDRHVMKTNDKLTSIQRNTMLMKTLHECGIPVAYPIPTADGKDFAEHEGKYYLLMNRLPGKHILDIYQEDHVRIAYETGKTVAKLHQAFQCCEAKIPFWDNSLLEEMNGWISETLKNHQYPFLSEADFKSSASQLAECYVMLPRQLIHRDIHFGNLLFEDGALSGYIDFDLSQKNVRIFDLSYFLMGLLIGHEKKTADVEKWYQIISGFIQGYEETAPLTSLEKDSIVCLMENIELLFVAYFIRMENEELAKGAADLFYFIRDHKERIDSAIRK